MQRLEGLGRFDRQVFVPPPDDLAQAEMFRIKLASVPTVAIDFMRLATKASTPPLSEVLNAPLVAISVLRRRGTHEVDVSAGVYSQTTGVFITVAANVATPHQLSGLAVEFRQESIHHAVPARVVCARGGDSMARIRDPRHYQGPREVLGHRCSERRLDGVAPALPTGVLGAAVAVELLRALEAAALSDPPTWTGTTIELFSRLHKKGLLASIPADQAGRAALKLLADRTPLVRRLHYRRWCFAFGDVHEPASALRGRLGVIAE